jgi:ureidoglycolate lyase
MTVSEIPVDCNIVTLKAAVPDRASFAPFGTLILPDEDGTPFGADDAVLDFSQGTPRFYIMRLDHRGMDAKQITRHKKVTQCLATAGSEPWLIALAPPSSLAMPEINSIQAFKILPGTAIQLHAGTWHAGPFFQSDTMNFFNLELSDTNETDHENAYLAKGHGVVLRLQD